MENDVKTLDEGFVESHITYNRASSGKRFLNLIIDHICIYLALTIVYVILAGAGMLNVMETGVIHYLIYFSLYFIYYVSLEHNGGKTIGKMLTKTQVKSEDGSNPTLSKIFLRTLARLIPFEPFSFLGNNSGWHDRATDTMVVQKA